MLIKWITNNSASNCHTLLMVLYSLVATPPAFPIAGRSDKLDLTSCGLMSRTYIAFHSQADPTIENRSKSIKRHQQFLHIQNKIIQYMGQEESKKD